MYGVGAECQRVASLGIGESPFAAAEIHDGGTNERFATCGVNDAAADGECLGFCLGKGCAQQ